MDDPGAMDPDVPIGSLPSTGQVPPEQRYAPGVPARLTSLGCGECTQASTLDIHISVGVGAALPIISCLTSPSQLYCAVLCCAACSFEDELDSDMSPERADRVTRLGFQVVSVRGAPDALAKCRLTVYVVATRQVR